LQKRLLQIICSRPNIHLLVLASIGAALYFFTLPYPFVFDDRVLLLNNPLIKNSISFFDLFDYGDFVSEYLPRVNDPDMVSSFALRPLAYTTFRLNYLFGGTNPAGYRAVNIAIHIANAIMLYHLLRELIRSRTEQRESDSIVMIPVFASLLFLVHPLQTESVTYITQRFTSLGTGFYLATVLLYVLSILSKARVTKILLYSGSLATLILGMQTKEFVFTAPFSLCLISIIVLRKSIWATLRSLVPHMACLVIVPFMVLIVNEDLAGNAPSLGAGKIMNFSGFTQSEYAITQLRVVLSYFRLLVLPYNLNFDPDYPLFKSVIHPEIILSIIIWAAFLAAVLMLLKRTARSIEADLVLFSLLWFPLLLCVSSSIVPLPDLMSEHRTYLPSLAFCIGMTAHVQSLRQRYSVEWGARLAVGMCILIALFSLLTIQRNNVYSSRLVLWSDTSSKSPMKARPAMALGNICVETGQDDGAFEWLNKAITLNPHYQEAYLSLGSFFMDNGMPNNAIDLYETYLASHIPETRILSNLALAYQSVGDPYRAIEVMKSASTNEPDDEKLLIIIAELLFHLDRDQEAQLYLEQAKKLDQENPLADFSWAYKMLEQNYGDANQFGGGHVGKVQS